LIFSIFEVNIAGYEALCKEMFDEQPENEDETASKRAFILFPGFEHLQKFHIFIYKFS
jgi:hypothetical protein